MKIEKVIEDALAQIDEKLRQCITVNIAGNLSVQAHQPTLTQVILNLISNGLKFYPKDKTPHVDVNARREGKNVLLTVHDEGIGIAPEHQERIFQVFERLHSVAAYPGTGIGLAIVKRGIIRMGGTVRVKSAPGKGSTFYITLPSA